MKWWERRGSMIATSDLRAVPSLAMRQVAIHTCQGLDAQGHVEHAAVDGYRNTKRFQNVLGCGCAQIDAEPPATCYLSATRTQVSSPGSRSRACRRSRDRRH